MHGQDNFDLSADKSTLDLEALINVAANSIYDATGKVEDCKRELRSHELEVFVHKTSETLSRILIGQESSAWELAKAARRLADAWRAYHHLVATRDRTERIVE